MREVLGSGLSRRSPRASVLSNVFGSRDHGLKSRFGMRSGNCALSWIGGKPPTAKRTFIEEYESCWNCSGKAQARCKNGHELEGQMQGTQLRYVIKFVADMDKAVKFYRDVLGLKVKFESPGWSEFVTGETTLALHPASEKNPAGKVELGFTVVDVEAFYRDMSAKGVLFSMPPKKQDFGGVLAQFVDSEGAHCSVGAEAA